MFTRILVLYLLLVGCNTICMQEYTETVYPTRVISVPLFRDQPIGNPRLWYIDSMSLYKGRQRDVIVGIWLSNGNQTVQNFSNDISIDLAKDTITLGLYNEFRNGYWQIQLQGDSCDYIGLKNYFLTNS